MTDALYYSSSFKVGEQEHCCLIYNRYVQSGFWYKKIKGGNNQQVNKIFGKPKGKKQELRALNHTRPARALHLLLVSSDTSAPSNCSLENVNGWLLKQSPTAQVQEMVEHWPVKLAEKILVSALHEGHVERVNMQRFLSNDLRYNTPKFRSSHAI